MTRWRKVKAVSTYEFLSTVKRKGYIILTFGMPLILAAYIGFISLIGNTVGKDERKTKIFGVVDTPGILRLSGDTAAPLPELPAEAKAALELTGRKAEVEKAMAIENSVFRPYADVAAAAAALNSDEIKGYYIIPANYKEKGEIDYYVLEKDMNLMSGGSTRPMSEMLQQRMLADRVPPDIAARLKEPVAKRHEWKITTSGETKPVGQFEELAKFLMPLLFGMLFMFSVLFTGGALLQAVAVEKENKVVDVLISSAYPEEILMGKLLGQGAAGLLQIAVWFGMIAIGGLLFFGLLAEWGISIPWLAISVAPLFFVAGYLLLGSLMVGIGSLGNNMRESQQLTWVLNMLPAVPFFFLMLILRKPNGVTAQVLSWIPFTAGQTMMIRLSAAPAGVHWWEILGALVLMIITTWFCIKIGARFFRVGLLLTGARPKFREVMRQAGLMS